MKSINLPLISFLFFFVLSNSFGQQKKIDSSKAGFGGPDQVERRLSIDNESKISIFELHFLEPYLV